MTVNGGEVSGYVNDAEHGGSAKLRSAVEHNNFTNLSVFAAWVQCLIKAGALRAAAQGPPTAGASRY